MSDLPSPHPSSNPTPVPSPGASPTPASGPRTPRTERDLIIQALEAAHTPASGTGGFAGDLPPAGTFPGYELIREVHRGGQGAVFLAVQLATKRRVAIKLMHGGPFRGSTGRARFEREVQILGQLNHPNIVRIHDSGTTTDGSNFYVMDYVSGRSLDEVISTERRPTIEETLRLFLKICDGINAAHLKGIIHRDIKPSNIRISTSGEPVVVDFGLAKVALPGGSSDANPAIMSMTGQFIGSLPWASPEQAQGVHEHVDVRTDVYSLGVVLYQLLTGKFPYDVIGNMRDVLDRILRAEPARPSTVRRQINDEVETIVLKCLAKERERRYQSAGELARDIERYLGGQPIEAKRDSVFYVVTKTARRYWPIAAVASTILVASTVFAIVMSVLYNQKALAEKNLSESLAESRRLEAVARTERQSAERARDGERQERERAEAALEAALAPARQMLVEFDPQLKNLLGATRIRLSFLDAGKEYLRRLEERAGNDPAIDRERALVHERLGEMMAEIGDKRIGETDEGLAHLERALELRESLAKRTPGDPLARADLARSVRSKAAALRLQQNPEPARDEYRRAISLFDEALAQLPPGSTDRRAIEEQRIKCFEGLGSSLARMALLAPSADAAAVLQSESEARYGDAESYWLRRRDADPGDADAARNALSARNAQAEHLVTAIAARQRQEKKYDQALATLDRVDGLMTVAVERLSALGKDRPQDRKLQRDLSISLHLAGWSLQERADCIARRARDQKQDPPSEYRAILERATERFERAYAIAAILESSDADDLEAKRDVFTLTNKLGNMQRELGRVADPSLLEKARQTFARSLETRQAVYNADPINRHLGDLVVGIVKMGDIEKELAGREQDPDRAGILWRSALDRYSLALRHCGALIERQVRPKDWNVVPQVEEAARACRSALGLEASTEQDK
ncbi:MAG TPA: serine/threonine-protein kinase [Phycisphaerales bacterium]|nr:serine/threonine-protein kinase [Phycisphaerales bacterium]